MHQRLTNSSAKPESGPEFSVPATGCAGMRCTPAGTCGAMSLEHRALHRADVGDDRAGLERCGDLGRHRPACADRNADDDEVGVLRRLGVGLDHLIGDAELDDAPARRLRARGRDDRAHHAVFARRARDRAADQADADQREAVDDERSGTMLSAKSPPLPPLPLRGGGEAERPAPAITTPCRSSARRASDREPVRLLGADRHAQRVRQMIGRDRRASRRRAR